MAQPTIDGPSSICENTSAILSVVESYQSYEWNTGATTQSIMVMNPGTFTVTVTDQSSNMSSASHILSVNPLPQVQILGGNTLCQGSSKTLMTNTGFNSYQWSTNESNSSIVINTPGTYSVTVTDNNNCIGEASILITQVSNPTPNILGPDFICPGSTEILDAGNWSTYKWSDGRNTRQFPINDGGSFNVTVTDENGCSGVANKVVQAYDVTPITIDGNTEICDGESTSLSVNPSSGTIMWSTGEMVPSIQVNQIGAYGVTVTDANMCQVSELVLVSNPLPSISCPDDIYLTVHEPTLDTVVQFNIVVLNTCGASIPIVKIDTSGYNSGDSFPIGITPQSYILDTEEAQLGSCSFIVNIVQKSQNVIKMQNGDLYLKGIYRGAIYQSLDGTCWKIVISNEGEIKALKIDCPG